MGWWGYLVDGEPARFPSINTRAERLADTRRPLPSRAIVPATYWREMQKPSRLWHQFKTVSNDLLGLAAVTRPGRTSDGQEFVCYSLVMQPAAPHLEAVHDRMPLIVGAEFVTSWLDSTADPRDLLAAAVDVSSAVSGGITVSREEPDESNRGDHALF